MAHNELSRPAASLSPCFWLLLILTAAIGIGAVPSDACARDDVPEDVAHLENPVVLEESELRYYKRQYKGKCARCHGKDGSGGTERVEPPLLAPADFTDAKYMASRTDGQFFYLRVQFS